MCSKCKNEKPLSEFYKHRQCKMGVSPKCKECSRAEQKFVYEMRKKFGDEFSLAEFNKLPEGLSKCQSCGEIKEKDSFYKDINKSDGVSSYCKPCVLIKQREKRALLGDKALATRRKWAEANRERLREQDKIYRESNREKMRVIEQRRRARKQSLPDTLTEDETKTILTHFGNKCALCNSPAESLDHFIPLATGKGGTTKENIVPLCNKMNSSKLARNPFIWAEQTLNEDGRERFNELIEYLSKLNGLSVKKYREFVFSCFKNTKIS